MIPSFVVPVAVRLGARAAPLPARRRDAEPSASPSGERAAVDRAEPTPERRRRRPTPGADADADARADPDRPPTAPRPARPPTAAEADPVSDAARTGADGRADRRGPRPRRPARRADDPRAARLDDPGRRALGRPRPERVRQDDAAVGRSGSTCGRPPAPSRCSGSGTAGSMRASCAGGSATPAAPSRRSCATT